MAKNLFVLLLLLFTGVDLAYSCNEIEEKQNRAPFQISNGIVCFMEQTIQTTSGDTLKGIAVYFLGRMQKPARVKDAVYDSKLAKIENVFTINIRRDGDYVVVIQSLESASEQDSTNKLYSVYLLGLQGRNLVYNERLSNWFGSGLALQYEEDSIIYEYPYQYKGAIEEAFLSPYASLMHDDKPVSMIVNQKSYLYKDKNIKDKTNKYLLEGDNVAVDKYTAGWCRVNYQSKKKTLQMWMICSALRPDSVTEDKVNSIIGQINFEKRQEEERKHRLQWEEREKEMDAFNKREYYKILREEEMKKKGIKSEENRPKDEPVFCFSC